MKVVIRVDASRVIGAGHVMRCLTLADAIRNGAERVVFVCREHEGNLCDLIVQRGFVVKPLPVTGYSLPSRGHGHWLGSSWEDDAAQTASIIDALGFKPHWLVVDHYALGQKWEHRLRQSAKHMMVIDDLADRVHECDLLLDQNYYTDLEGRYAKLLAPSCTALLGPKYSLLRPEFVQEREGLRERNGGIQRVLICFGGIDSSNETTKAINALLTLERPDLQVDVVTGQSSPHRKEIEASCAKRTNFKFHCQVGDMAALMAAADLSIGGGGSTTWERCALGLPAVVLALAFNQIPIASAVQSVGAVRYLGEAHDVSEQLLATELARLFERSDLVVAMSRAGMALVDALGCVRVRQKMEERIREDCNTLL